MRRAVRSFLFIATLVVSATAMVSRLFDLGASVVTEPTATNLAVMASLPQPLRVLEAHNKNSDTYTVAFMGDSTVMSYPAGQTLHERLHEELVPQWSSNGRVWVASLSSLGMTPAGFYLVQDEINDAHPDVAIVTANLALIRHPLPPMLKRPELAGWVRSPRIYKTLVELDLHEYGVTADRLLLYKSLVAADQVDNWYLQAESQTRLGRLRGVLESAVAEQTGWSGDLTYSRKRRLNLRVRTLLAGELERVNPTGGRKRLGEIMDGIDTDHWVLEVLRVILSDFAEAGTATVLYVPPINVEHFRKVGAYDEKGLAQSLGALEQIARETGAEFADLHDLLPDAAFRDSGGHFTHAPPHDGPVTVAQALAPYVLIQLRAVAQTR